jgi:hypothetical protein
MLALSLLGFILIFAITVLAQLVTTYNKGLTLTQINQAIRQLDNDVARGFRFNSPAAFKWYAYDEDRNPKQYIPNNESDWDGAEAGSFCANGVTYIWNMRTNSFFHYDDNVSNPTSVRLARIEDVGSDEEGHSVVSSCEDYNDGKINRAEKKVTNLLGSQSMVLSASVYNINAVGLDRNYDLGGGGIESKTDTIGRIFRVNFLLSTAGKFAAVTVDDGVNRHITCESTARAQTYCSFGEFNSIIYMRGK